MSAQWQALALTTVVLFLKMFAVAGVQGYHRLTSRAFVKPEDAAFFGKGATPRAEELPIVDRAQNTLRNDTENIPIFLGLAVCYAAIDCWPAGAWIYFPLFALSRIVHTLAFLNPRQPLRNRAYVLGQLVCFILCGHLVVKVLG